HFPTSNSAKHEGRALPPSSQPVLGCRMSQNPQKVARHSPKPCPSDTPGGILGGSTPYPPPRQAGLPKGNTMCRPVKCRNCGKTTWAGCGEHVDQVKASVPADQWCTCTRENPKPSGGFLAGLLGRK